MIYYNSTKLNFGKHKGKTILEVLESDFNYICWCIKEINNFKLSEESITALIDNKEKMPLPDDALIYYLETDADKIDDKECQLIINRQIADILDLNIAK